MDVYVAGQSICHSSLDSGGLNAVYKLPQDGLKTLSIHTRMLNFLKMDSIRFQYKPGCSAQV